MFQHLSSMPLLLKASVLNAFLTILSTCDAAFNELCICTPSPSVPQHSPGPYHSLYKYYPGLTFQNVAPHTYLYCNPFTNPQPSS